MNIKIKLKKGDELIILAGKDRGKTGKIVKVFPKEPAGFVILYVRSNIINIFAGTLLGLPGGKVLEFNEPVESIKNIINKLKIFFIFIICKL